MRTERPGEGMLPGPFVSDPWGFRYGSASRTEMDPPQVNPDPAVQA
jgi:hypothetical protein